MLSILITIFVVLVLVFGILNIISIFLIKKNNTFDIYFGVPGSGKTTFAAYLSKKRLKVKKKVYSNVPIKGTFKVKKEDIGCFDISDGLLLIDEAGISYNNRNYNKNFSDSQLDFFVHHRHYNVDIAVFSQFWKDPDVKLRNLATRIFILKSSFIPFFISRRSISKRVGIDKQTHDMTDEFYYIPLSRKLIFAPSVWKMFQTHERKELPKKEFEVYE